jgi:P27 family predicted phage terminase small subunit
MKGCKPHPTARRKLEGNPSRRPMNDAEPVLPVEDLEQPPPELDDEPVARAEWLRLLPMLKRAQAITDGDRGALVALCLSWARYLDANKKVRAAGMVVRAPSGYPMPNPYIAIANKALGNCVKLWVELGLTPSARTRVKTTGGMGPIAPDDPFHEFDDPLLTH